MPMEPASSNPLEAGDNVAEHRPTVALPVNTVITEIASTSQHHYDPSIGSSESRTVVDGVVRNDSENQDLGRLRALECNDALRYTRKFQLCKTEHKLSRSYSPPSLQRRYADPGLPDGWAKCTHPEGNVYFYHKDDKILTQNWMYDEDVAQLLDTEFRPLLSRVWKALLVPQGDYHIVVDIIDDVKGTNGKTFAHYVVDHDNLSIFWLNVHNGFKIDLAMYNIYDLSESQKQHHLEVMYWKHMSLFPHAREPTEDNWKDLFDVLTSIQTDVATSPASTSSYSESHLAKWMSIAQETSRYGPAASVVVGRFMHSIRQDQMFHYHGAKYARLNKDDSVFGFEDSNSGSRWFCIFSVLLFYVPVTYVGMLNSCWVDKLSQKRTLTDFLSGLNKEWDKYSLLATVFLAADMAFLAIPAFDNARDRDVDRDQDGSWTQAFIFLSIFSALGCIIMASLLLQRQYAPKKIDKVGKIHKHLFKMSEGLTGLHGTAIVYSLPYALLLWSVIFFSAGVLSVCFKDEAVPATRIVMGIVVFLTIFAVLWSLEKLWHMSIWIGDRLWEASDWIEGKVTWIRERVTIPYRSGTAQTTDASSNV